MDTMNYYSIVGYDNVRKLIAEKKIEVCRILSEKISEEILREAGLCHTMTYISLDFLNQASGGIVTVWNVQNYFNEIRRELNCKLYLDEDPSNGIQDSLFYIPLYTLDYGTEVIEQKYSTPGGDELYYNKYTISLKKKDAEPDGFLFFWNDVEKDDEKISNKPIHIYVDDQIKETIKKINAIMEKGEDTEFSVDITAEKMLVVDVTQGVVTDSETGIKTVDETASKEKQDEFTNLVNKYNSYKEVRI